jgi:ABC-type transport system involved in cytochrome bd biosynthesis fused ATPase/permease subunit
LIPHAASRSTTVRTLHAPYKRRHFRRPNATSSIANLDLERLADRAQLIAIAGADGRGKTTILDSFVQLC